MAAILPLQLQVSPKRLAFVVFVFVLSLHYLFNVVFKDASPLPTLLDLQNHIGISRISQHRFDNSSKLAVDPEVRLDTAPPIYVAPTPSDVAAPNGRANATFVLLCRNNDVNGAVASIQQMEDRFNRRHGYPWVLLNDEPFTDEFKDRVRILTDAPIHFGQIPREHWQQPDWVDEDHAKAGREKMAAQGIIYASSVSYRNMCRFNSGFFFHHELLQPYRYYWRVEPDVKFFCDVNYDPFRFMQDNNKTYGYTIALVEWEATIPSLWSTVKEFVAKHPEYVSPDNSLQFLSDDGGNSYNLCHFWSNFEIADMDFWRGEAYQQFFDYLESKGGFYYERWGDAPVHSIAAALFARKNQIHFFRDIGYRHDNFQHCPSGNDWVKGRCACDPKDSFDYGVGSCRKKHEELFL